MPSTAFDTATRPDPTDRQTTRRKNLRSLLDEYGQIDSLDIRYVLAGTYDCPQFVIVTTDGYDDYRLGLCSTLDECGAELVRRLKDDFPYREVETVNLDTGDGHHFSVTATPGPAEKRDNV
jgi:hypothetical protein